MVCLGHRHQSEHSCALLEEVARPMAATKAVVAAVLATTAPMVTLLLGARLVTHLFALCRQICLDTKNQ